jgi:1,4-dihydroxy-2-naphthoate octaprenyltransferase
MPCLAILADGIRRGVPVRLGVAIPSILGALFLQIAINLYNDVSDYLKLIDLPGTPGGSGAFHRGWYTPREILNYARIAAVLGVLAGIPALLLFPVEILTLGLLGLGGALLYSNERFGLKYFALGDGAVLLLCGPAITAGMSIAAFGMLIPSVVAIGLVLGLFACGLLHVNNLQDMEFDRARGAETLALKLGFLPSVLLFTALYGLAFSIGIVAVAFKILPLGALLFLLAAIPATKLLAKVRRAIGPTSPTLEGTRIEAAQVHLLAGILLTLGTVVSKWIGIG